MKFLPSLSPLALSALALALSSCANPANQRELYNTSQANSGPWHDYERRREAEAETGVSGGTAPTVVPGARGRATAQPPSSALPAGTTVAPGAPAAPPAVGAPVPAQATDTSSTAAPPVPVNPPSGATGAVPTPDAAPGAIPATPDAAATPAVTSTPSPP